MAFTRTSGVLLPISSLPSKYGIGCFSKEAYEFVDQLVKAGQSYWQILPLGPTGYGDSPYQSVSTYAGNPYFICLEDLIKEGLLRKSDCEKVNFGDNPAYCEYGILYTERYKLLRKAYENARLLKVEEKEEYQKFIREQAYWLDDYALYMAVKPCFGGKAYTEWAEDIRMRWGYSMDYYRNTYPDEIRFQKFLQFKFYEQWNKLKKYANKNGIKIIGDIPIYVSPDSVDLWASPWLFQLDENNLPKRVAGCPPDGFSADGQLWGNPLYKWDVLKNQNYDWWISRLRHVFEMYDVVRIDHFRGFDEYFSIKYGEKTARDGHWEKGPGIDLFETIKKRLPGREIIAEDLGYMTDTVRKLVKDSGYPNMKVIEFAFDSRDTGSANDYLPHNYDKNCVVYTGTHDNETLVSWFENIKDVERAQVRDYLMDDTTPDDQIYKKLIRICVASSANLCVIPMQDLLGLDNSARMNHPSTLGTNWKWRMLPGQFTDEDGAWLRDLCRRYGRLSDSAKKEDYEKLMAAEKAAKAALKAAKGETDEEDEAEEDTALAETVETEKAEA